MPVGLRILHLIFNGPKKPPAVLRFGPGLNLIYGASDTGKSFVVQAIDFMLGAKDLKDIPERVGYDHILLGVESLMDNEQFTIYRSAEGGGFRVYAGLHTAVPSGVEAIELSQNHNEKNAANLSRFLLIRTGLDGKKVRRNKSGATNSLSFRNIARLLIIDESEIMKQASPLDDGMKVNDTVNFSTFKLLLTGVDNSSLVVAKASPEEQSQEIRLELLEELLHGFRKRLSKLVKNPEELRTELAALENLISDSKLRLKSSEAQYRTKQKARVDLRQRLEEALERRAEIKSLLKRFDLLDQHYVSDLSRLSGIVEGGTLFEILGQAHCPLCGADPESHRTDVNCDGNVRAVVKAANREISKIQLLRRELQETVLSLGLEVASIEKRLPKFRENLDKAAGEVERVFAPNLGSARADYEKVTSQRAKLREALVWQESIEELEGRINSIAPEQGDTSDAAGVTEADLSAAVADQFALEVRDLLQTWHFPECDRVHFDARSRDLIINGKPRTSRGKGLRAITHAAFTVGLMEYCRRHNTPHPGFVILDTPLRAYKEPDGQDDDLSGTDLNIRFYEFLESLSEDRQVIIIENSDPPVHLDTLGQTTKFGKNPTKGRYGFFPITSLE